MLINDYLRIAELTNDCPNCGYGNVGTNQETGEHHGSLEVNDNLFTRKCRCGFEITIDANNGTSRSKLKKQIGAAVEKFNNKKIHLETIELGLLMEIHNVPHKITENDHVVLGETAASHVCRMIQYMKEQSIQVMDYTEDLPDLKNMAFQVGDKVSLEKFWNYGHDEVIHVVTKVYKNEDKDGESYPEYVIACSCDTFSEENLKKEHATSAITCPYCIHLLGGI